MAKFDFVRLGALIRKETVQMLRDPSTILVAFLLPVILLLLFAFAVSLDIKNLPIALVRESDSVKSQSLAAAYQGTKFFVVHDETSQQKARDLMVSGKVRGIVTIPHNFDARLTSPSLGPLVEIISDGAQPNTARFIAGAASSVVQEWLAQTVGSKNAQTTGQQVNLIPRYWFNAEIESRRTLIPGAIAIVMTMIGTLLTAMVVAREWERGTMEAIMATPANTAEILFGKLLPYFGLGMMATLICGVLATAAFSVPLRGSWLALMAFSSAFLIPALGQGLLISIVTKNQFAAAQLALFTGFLPAMMFSGFLYEISSMPLPLRILSQIVAARYYVSGLRTVFLVGDVWKVLIPNILYMLAIGAFFFFLAWRNSSKTLDGK